MKKVSVYVPQSAVIEAVTPAYRLFNTANQFLEASGQEPLFDVEFVGLERHIKAQDGEYTITVSKLLDDVKQTDMVVIPAVYGDLPQALERNKPALSWIVDMHKQGAEIASLCLGAFLLADTGLIDGKRCSTHWAYYNEFRSQFPNVEIVDGAIITDEGRIYSSGGANSIWNMLLYLLEKHTNRDIAILSAKYFAIDIDRDNQNAFTIFRAQKDHRDPEILKAQDFIEDNFTEKITIDILADKVNVSRRSFERRFKSATNNTVSEYIQRVRIESAKRSFEASLKHVNEVMYDVGYTDTKSFRDVFKKVTGLTPVEYRNKYSKN
ncbi:helix-turn-helix domain-containing protein [Flavobacterium sp. MAH-1]|uniref:Helix-turn-helix domain-containing protein n=1 Tax=Flavobacterium agri TaxID=2743471 RepID=A0A7Y9C5M7_9FLAO|nr:helix-turn-helix domain-containing protein [Flavobacterium agri]NUY79503.1 helix-turn-helix domain-containing protein [Flavobacterium agri]NYA69528.1 helix-turn-helix domain-containing protein [Flavobacterium agri]